MELTSKDSQHNFYAFLWHGAFLAFAQNFTDVDTIVPAMIIEAGGSAFHIGLMTAIMVGGASMAQLFFAPMLSNQAYKKAFLLTGIKIRVVSLLALGIILYFALGSESHSVLAFIFIFISLFALSGSFATISYMDIIGKSILPETRKRFFSTRSVVSAILVFGAAFLARSLVGRFNFPVNYALLFFIGAILLLIASLGFWRLRETQPSSLPVKSFSDFFSIMKQELKQNKRLVFFLGFINTQGIALSFLPFVVLFAKEKLGTAAADTGNFLILKIAGIVVISLLTLLLSKKIKYNKLLYANAGISLFMGVSAFFLLWLPVLPLIFVLGGISYSLYNITMSGVLLEVSRDQTRALYTGFTGAGSLIPIIFPLIGGPLIKTLGFFPFFGLFAIIISLSFYFIYKMDCKR